MEDTKEAGLLDGLLKIGGNAKTSKNTALTYRNAKPTEGDPWASGDDPLTAAVAAGDQQRRRDQHDCGQRQRVRDATEGGVRHCRRTSCAKTARRRLPVPSQLGAGMQRSRPI